MKRALIALAAPLAWVLSAPDPRWRGLERELELQAREFAANVRLTRYAFECGRWNGATATARERRRIRRQGPPAISDI